MDTASRGATATSATQSRARWSPASSRDPANATTASGARKLKATTAKEKNKAASTARFSERAVSAHFPHPRPLSPRLADHPKQFGGRVREDETSLVSAEPDERQSIVRRDSKTSQIVRSEKTLSFPRRKSCLVRKADLILNRTSTDETDAAVNRL